MKAVIVVLVALAAVAQAGQQSSGYSNLTNGKVIWNWRSGDPRPGQGGSRGTPEVGDLVTLAGSDRKLKSVTVWLGSTEREPNGTVDVTVRVRALDAATGLPGNVLATASQTGVSYSTWSWQVTLNMTQVTLPGQVVVTVELSNGTQDGYGVVAAQGVTLGSSDPEAWFMRALGTGTWGQSTGQGVQNGNLGLAVTVGP